MVLRANVLFTLAPATLHCIQVLRDAARRGAEDVTVPGLTHPAGVGAVGLLFSMLVLVLGANFVIFIGWEGVGLCRIGDLKVRRGPEGRAQPVWALPSVS